MPLKAFEKPLSREEEVYYLQLCSHGDKEARRVLIEHNLRLVAHIVKKYTMQGKDCEDLISIGTIGLIKAIDTFDYSKGNRLVTYASRCIDNELLMMLRHEKKLNREVSIYEPIGTDKEGNEINLMDILDSKSASILDSIINAGHIEILRDILTENLRPRELYILCKRYGLETDTPMTQKEVASELGISRSYVSRIEKSALKKLKTAYENKKA